ncbi:hypothetical protein EMIHUDRAFT_456722 [Emiliania huxleyi CCMP1516]|uniref:Uncharacterized protein n=4 Tax=Emiliania huxleyi TaxID=2903 RepID=A0A0D3K216_EMIH1|nr:hypothetical protein EMIHUDRAFT_447844 [Emiliania huxleyi CCMP1516]XP_005782230.1 hypothetical protein EMIHUDRAFT_456722 [Emiliania huxleyi CCMP1516]EOD23147.1 hypothetical protein EMIHUDRAFT_447844 [Emiliania huxleyi CCMP1516]EOD29801.1 hypothetical protein EMIHUDRAFT_456722 [Emiliania huxleyi CCMP1516]|eukprot:XP_005775576.1 hypothetical protein EMIHUDRAFT_447844 [Emiliania huxleyi CCMP1516]
MSSSSWRPETVDPMGKAMGVPRAPARTWELWLDLRTSEVTFAQMVVVKLFYSVRRVIDEAGKALPQGAGVQGLLFAEPRFDPADTIGLELPVFVEAPDGVLLNCTGVSGPRRPLEATLRAPASVDELCAAQDAIREAGDGGTASVVALPADPLLWAVALTGLEECQLEAKEGNAGA